MPNPKTEDATKLPKERTFVSWAALITILGAINAFWFGVLLTTFDNVEETTDARLINIRDATLHLDTEVRRDIRQLQDRLDDHIDSFPQKNSNAEMLVKLPQPLLSYPLPEFKPVTGMVTSTTGE